MRNYKVALATVLTMALSLLVVVSAVASPTREFVGSFGSLQEPAGIAVDQETGNVYVVEAATNTIDVFGASGGAPTGGVPAQITGLTVNRLYHPRLGETGEQSTGVAVDNSCFEHVPKLVGKACEEYDPSNGDVYVAAGGVPEVRNLSIQKFRLNSGRYELASEFFCAAETFYEANAVCESVAVDSRGNIYATGRNANGDFFEFRKIVEKVVVEGKEEFQEKLERIKIPQDLVGKHEIGGAKNGVGPEDIVVYDPGVVYISNGYEVASPPPAKDNVGRLHLSAAGVVESEEVFMGPLPRGHETCWRPVALDPAADTVFVGEGYEVAELNSAGEL